MRNDYQNDPQHRNDQNDSQHPNDTHNIQAIPLPPSNITTYQELTQYTYSVAMQENQGTMTTMIFK